MIEVKATGDDAWVTADGKQVSRYWGRYGQVLVTNYRDSVFVGQDPDGNPVKLETYRLAENETGFWATAAHARKMAGRAATMRIERRGDGGHRGNPSKGSCRKGHDYVE